MAILCRISAGRPLPHPDIESLRTMVKAEPPPAQAALIARCLGYGPASLVLGPLVELLASAEPGVVREALASIRQAVPWSGLAPWGNAENPDDCFDIALPMVFSQMSLKELAAQRILEHLSLLEGAWSEVRHALDSLGQGCRTRFDEIIARRQSQNTPAQITVIPSYQCNVRCKYCYMLERIDNPGPGITYEKFETVVQHAMKLGCSRVGFSGGEPTFHPEFGRFLKLLYQHKLTTFFASNIIFPRALVESMDARYLGSVTAHLRPRPDYTDATWRLFLDNLHAMRERGVHVMLRYSVEPGGTVELDRLIDTCERSGVRQINMALAIPSPGGGNEFVSAADFRGHVRDFVDAVRALRARGYRTGISKPLPPCVLSPEDRRFLNDMPYAMGTCSIWKVGNTHNVVVNPDGSVWPCIVVDENVGNFFAFHDLASLGSAIQTVIDKRAGRHFFQECPTCRLFQLKRCQGACLAYKT